MQRNAATTGTNDTLLIKINGTSDVLTVNSQFNAIGNYRIEQILFDDGTVWGSSVLNVVSIMPTATGAYGATTGADWFDLRSRVNSTAYGFTSAATDSGNDTYLFSTGAGQDIIQDYGSAAGNIDVLNLTGSLSESQIWFRHVGNNLEVSAIGTGDKVTIQNWYTGSAYWLEQITLDNNKVLSSSNVENLVQAMSSYTPPALGETTLPESYSSLIEVIGTNWQ